MLFLTWKLINSDEQWARIGRQRYLNKGQPKAHYLTSSTWPGMKQHIQMVLNHSTWAVGNGKCIQFWTDKWMDRSIAFHWNLPASLTSALSLKVADCIVDGNWCIPAYVVHRDPALASQIHKITLLVDDIPDRLCWSSANDGELTNKIAYRTLNGTGQSVPWAKLIWTPFIPPSRSFITWRLIHNKLPTDDNLRKRGCYIVSICCFCMQNAESSSHIFFACPVTMALLDWLSKGTGAALDCSSCLHLISGTVASGGKMVHQILTSAISHTIWTIWIERNQRYFHDKRQAMSSLFNSILAEVKLSHSLNLVKGNSTMIDYKVAKLFNIPFKIKNMVPSRNISWKPPPTGVVKFNCDGSSVGPNPCGSIGVVIRDSNANFLGALASNVGYASPLESEFSAIMSAIEKAQAMHLHKVCLESDSMGVVNAYNKDVGVPWQMRARWHNCMRFCKSITCTLIHTLREGNMVADVLAKHGQGLSLYSTQWWSTPPTFITSLLLRDQLGLPFYRLDMA